MHFRSAGRKLSGDQSVSTRLTTGSTCSGYCFQRTKVVVMHKQYICRLLCGWDWDTAAVTMEGWLCIWVVRSTVNRVIVAALLVRKIIVPNFVPRVHDRYVGTVLMSTEMFVSGVREKPAVGHKLWPLSALVKKQSTADHEAIRQGEKIKIPSYLSSRTSMEKHTYTKSKRKSDAVKGTKK